MAKKRAKRTVSKAKAPKRKPKATAMVAAGRKKLAALFPRGNIMGEPTCKPPAVSDDSCLYKGLSVSDDSHPKRDYANEKPPEYYDATPAEGTHTAPVSDAQTQRDTDTDSNQDEEHGTPPPIGDDASQDDTGDSPAIVADGEVAAARAQARVVASGICMRMKREGKWSEAVNEQKNAMIKEARAGGMDQVSAKLWAWNQVDRLNPPDAVEAESPIDESPQSEGSQGNLPSAPPQVESGGVRGLGDIPDNWPEPMPDNASLPVELAWVQAQRLRVIDDRGNTTHVHLDRATTPAPSMSALAWLETSVRSYAKYTDVAARVLGASSDDDSEHVRREHMDIAAIRRLLEQVIEAKEEGGA